MIEEPWGTLKQRAYAFQGYLGQTDCSFDVIEESLCVVSLCFLGLVLPFLCLDDELEPRLWNHLPIQTNFAGGAYANSRADIAFDPVLLIENVEMELHTWAVKYIRTFAVFEKSARIGFTQSFQEDDGQD